MSSSLSWGKSRRISSTVMPSATMPTTVATGMRVPRTQGTPPMIRWSTTTRSNITTPWYAPMENSSPTSRPPAPLTVFSSVNCSPPAATSPRPPPAGGDALVGGDDLPLVGAPGVPTRPAVVIDVVVVPVAIPARARAAIPGAVPVRLKSAPRFVDVGQSQDEVAVGPLRRRPQQRSPLGVVALEARPAERPEPPLVADPLGSGQSRPDRAPNSSERLLRPGIMGGGRISHHRGDRHAAAPDAENVAEQLLVGAEPSQVGDKLFSVFSVIVVADIDDDQLGVLDPVVAVVDGPVLLRLRGCLP